VVVIPVQSVYVVPPVVTYEFNDNLNAVIDVANELKINRKHLECLGMMEGVQFTAIKAGQHIPPPPEYGVDTQIYNVFSRTMYVIYEYNILRNYAHGTKDNPLSAFITREKIEKWALRDLGPKLPDIYDEFNEKFEYFKQTRKPRDLHAWLIREFCAKLLTILHVTDTALTKITKAFFFYIAKKILRYDELTTKRGWFNMGLLYGDADEQTTVRTTMDGESDEPLATAEDDNPFDVGDFDVEDGFNEDGEDVEIKISGD
jgi:hypothetical protein